MGRKGSNKEAKELAEFCARQPGVRVVEGTKHYKVFPADKTKAMVRIPRTPSDWRSLENCKAELRRAGIAVAHRGGK
ncbi:MAG: hypothetical protein WAT66_04760 [Actinomycetota bacterium]